MVHACLRAASSVLLAYQHVLRHKSVGVLSSEKHPLQQLHFKRGVGVFSRVGLFLGDYGTLFFDYPNPGDAYIAS